MDIRNGDCLTLMKSIPDKSVDLMICDLPYGETNCKWIHRQIWMISGVNLKE